MNRATVIGGLFALVVLTGVSIMLFKAYTEPAVNTGQNSVNQAEKVSRQQEIEQFESALEMYRIDNGKYPNTAEEVVPKYIAKVPADIDYRAIDEGSGYELCYRPSNQAGQPDVDRVCILPGD